MDNITIKPVTDDDLLDFAHLFWQYRNEELANEPESLSQKVCLEKALSNFEDSKKYQQIMRDDAVAIGIAEGKESNSGSYVSDGIFIVGYRRGEGLGKLIKQEQIKYAKDIGFPVMNGFVLDTNTASLATMRSLNIELIGKRAGYTFTIDLSQDLSVLIGEKE
tara:strand:- start:6606 stop:7094 length:489 start_codon:yes stop_codon:yes gene_type:complete